MGMHAVHREKHKVHKGARLFRALPNWFLAFSRKILQGVSARSRSAVRIKFALWYSCEGSTEQSNFGLTSYAV
jgi:hypothetical protein